MSVIQRNLSCTSGTITAHFGDRFESDGMTWKIVRFTSDYTYSPSSLGGTPTVFCKVVAGEMTDFWKRWLEPDGTVEWCGDSVAVQLLERQKIAS